MADISWPQNLPQEMRIPTEEQMGDQTIRTRMDAGPEKVRTRYTAVPDEFTTSMMMTGQQYKALKNFYKVTLGGGALRFDWEDPVTDNVVEMRFKEPPSGRIVAGGDSDSRQWMVNLNIEKMP